MHFEWKTIQDSSPHVKNYAYYELSQMFIR